MEFIFEHTPIAKMRHRTRRGIPYDPQAVEKINMRKIMAFMVQQELSSSKERAVAIGELCTSTSFIVHFLFEFPCPNSDSDSTKNLKMWGTISHNIKPDLSNLVKFYEDCANGTIFKDDSMIISGGFEKKYSPINKPRVVMTVIPKKERAQDKTKEVLKLINPCRVRELMKACHTITTLPLNHFEESSNENREEYLEYISLMLIKFANEFSNDLTRIKKKCSMDMTNGNEQ